MYGKGFDMQVGEYDDTVTRSDSMSDSEYMSEALSGYAADRGALDTEREWISSPFDTWHRNPYFKGTPGRHPEADYDDE